MSVFRTQDNTIFLSSEPKRSKHEPKTYTSRKNDRHRSRKHSTNAGTSPTKGEKSAGPPVLVLDNGAYTAKIGMSTDDNAKTVPNCIMKVKSERKRFFIGNQIDECRDLSGLYYLLPCEKGYIMKWTVQKPVWDYLFNTVYPVEDRPVILTQPMFNFKSIQEITDEIFFEEYEIKSIFKVNPTDLARYQYVHSVSEKDVPCVIVDCGYSFTNIVPYISGKKYYKAVRRIAVGGKLLTNYLKEIISYRQLHVMDETYVINQAKEDTCYVSLNFNKDMKTAKLYGDENTIVKNYVLPDFNSIRRGFIQDSKDPLDNCQILRLNNERFTVPEILFHPSNIGLESMGIAEAIVSSILMCPTKDQPILAKNIVVIGGCANFAGFKERILNEVKSHLPDHWNVNVYKPENPVTFSWKGGRSLTEDSKFKSLLVTKEQYEEKGSLHTYERFNDWLHTKINIDDDSKRAKEINHSKSILQNGNFSRFDLFGKYEPEKDETNVVDDDNMEINSGSENTRNSENSNYADSSKDVEVESTNSKSATSEAHQSDADDISKLSSSKILKTLTNFEEVEPEIVDNDFNIFENTYI